MSGVPCITDCRQPGDGKDRSWAKNLSEGADAAAAYSASSRASYARHAASVAGAGPASAGAGASATNTAPVAADRKTTTLLAAKLTPAQTAIAIRFETTGSMRRTPVSTAVSPRLPASDTAPFQRWNRIRRPARSRDDDGGRSFQGHR